MMMPQKKGMPPDKGLLGQSVRGMEICCND